MAYAIACRVGQGSVDLCIIEPSLVDFLARGLGALSMFLTFLSQGNFYWKGRLSLRVVDFPVVRRGPRGRGATRSTPGYLYIAFVPVNELLIFPPFCGLT